MNKRGIERNTVLLLLLLIAVIIVLTPILNKAAAWADGYFQGGVCQASAALASARVNGPCVSATSPTALNCPKRYVNIGENEATLILKDKMKEYAVPRPDGGYATNYNIDGAVVDSIFAEEMRYCWEKFGEGEMWLFPEGSRGMVDFLTATSDRTVCFICSEISFEKPDLAFANSDLRTYLQKTTMPGASMSYETFFNNPKTLCEEKYDKPPGCWTTFEKRVVKGQTEGLVDTALSGLSGEQKGIAPLQGPTKPNNLYAVVMMRQRFDKCQNTDTTAGAEMNAFVYVVPQNNLHQACDMVIS